MCSVFSWTRAVGASFLSLCRSLQIRGLTGREGLGLYTGALLPSAQSSLPLSHLQLTAEDKGFVSADVPGQSHIKYVVRAAAVFQPTYEGIDS